MPETSPRSLPKSLSDTYVVERELSRRDGVTTLVARDTRDGRLVAVNLVRPDVVRPALLVAELGVLKSLQHPNILRVLESGHGPAGDGGSTSLHRHTIHRWLTLRQRSSRSVSCPREAIASPHRWRALTYQPHLSRTKGEHRLRHPDGGGDAPQGLRLAKWCFNRALVRLSPRVVASMWSEQATADKALLSEASTPRVPAGE